MLKILLQILTVFIFATPLNAENLFLPKVAKGFSISVYAEIENARQMAVAEDGTLFVGTRNSGKVWAVQDKDNDGFAETKTLLLDSLNLPSGIAYLKGDLYIAEVHQVLRLEKILSQLDKQPEAEVVYSDLPDKKHHGWKFIAFDENDFLYIPVGAPCNSCDPDNEQFAHLRKVNLTTKQWTIIAKGIRNTVGFDWHPTTGKLWFTDNGQDWMGNDKPADELNRIDSNGQHFGYPFIHGTNTADTKFYKQRPKLLKTSPPALELQAHVAPLGIHFYTGKMFPKKYINQLFLAEHGSWNRTTKVGYKVLLVNIEKDKVLSTDTFLSGFLEKGKVLGRPVAFAELKDGSLLVSDDFAGKIYRITISKNL